MNGKFQRVGGFLRGQQLIHARNLSQANTRNKQAAQTNFHLNRGSTPVKYGLASGSTGFQPDGQPSGNHYKHYQEHNHNQEQKHRPFGLSDY